LKVPTVFTNCYLLAGLSLCFSEQFTSKSPDSVDINERQNEDGDVVKQLKRFGDALSQVVGPQPDDITDLPSYFQGVKAQFMKLVLSPCNFSGWANA